MCLECSLVLDSHREFVQYVVYIIVLWRVL